MNTYERGFVDGLKEAYRLMKLHDLDLAPGRILTRIKQLSGDEPAPSDPQPPPDEPT